MLLSLLIWFPLCIAVSLFFFESEKRVRVVALITSVLQFILSCLLLQGFDSSQSALQFVERHRWIESVGVDYFLGVDGISLWLILLTTFLTPITILGSWTSINKKVRGFHVALLVLESAMLGSFLAMDSILFYVFFEASLIPMYFLIGIWGGKNRIYASVKFFIYTMVGSLFMLMAIIALMFMTETLPAEKMSASILDFYQLNLAFVGGELFNTQTLLFFAFAIAFAIKVPIFPFHTWLPDAHVQAPTPGSVLLAGVMLKMGIYGFMRFAMPIFPEATTYWSWLFMFLGVLGIIYGALVAMVQPDLKKLVAYSSVSHMGYIILGIFTLNTIGVTGGFYQMFSHGIATGALFLLVGMIYDRTGSREIAQYGGLASRVPIFTIIFLIITMSSIAVPLTSGFVGEFYILLGTFQVRPYFASFAVLELFWGRLICFGW